MFPDSKSRDDHLYLALLFSSCSSVNFLRNAILCLVLCAHLRLLLIHIWPTWHKIVQLTPAGGCILARAFFMKRRSANGLRVPKNGFQRAQKPAIWRGLDGTRNGTPKPHINRRDPCFRGPKGRLPKTLLPLGLARETRPNLTTFGGFLSPAPLSTDQQSWTWTKAQRSFRNNHLITCAFSQVCSQKNQMREFS